MRQSFLKVFNTLLLLIVLIGFAPASVANGIILDSLRVDYVGGSYLEVTFDSTTVFLQGDDNLLLLKYDGLITSTTLYSGFNGTLAPIQGSPFTFTLNVDESDVPTVQFVLGGETAPGGDKLVYYPTVASYDPNFLNQFSGCTADFGCPVTNLDLSYSLAPNEFTLTYNAGPNGRVNGESPQTVDFGADGSTVTAEPDANFHFVNWSDSSTANPRTDTNVQATVDVTASFEINSFMVTSSVDGDTGGSITPLGDQQVVWNETTEFTLAPESAYMIDSVTGSCGGSLNELTYTTHPITANCTVVANYKLKPDLMFENDFEEAPKLVFVTSSTSSGGLGGLSGADQTCNNLAMAAGLPGTYAAWLSTNTINAKDRIGDHTWVRVDGAVVAKNQADLIDTMIQNPINVNENGDTIASTNIWTGTGRDGTYAGPPVETCWSGGTGALFGNSAATDIDWTEVGWLPSCSSQFAIYCFGL